MAYTTINKGSSYFNTVLYTGTGANQSITGVGFKPDWVWLKARAGTASGSHQLIDAVRGTTKALFTDATNAEVTYTNGLTSFDIDGFSIGNIGGGYNGSGYTFASWNWLASNTTASNTSGSITSTVSANTTSGFSVGKTTGTLTSGTITVGHGMGIAPSMIFWKRTNGVSNWQVYHKSTGVNLTQLNTTGAVTSGTNYWGTPTSTTFTVENPLYGAAETYVFYAFAEIKGYSKFGTYTGNGSADGPFIYTGFKPAFVLAKRATTAGEDWTIYDNKRNTYNVVNKVLYPNSAGAEATASNTYDFLSNGFKLRSSDGRENLNGATFIYAAFAENPFVTSGGIPTTAR